jgi:hypothetical protein
VPCHTLHAREAQRISQHAKQQGFRAQVSSHHALGARRGPGQLAEVSPAARHALLYATQFFAFGVILPFLPAVLAARGLDPAERRFIPLVCPTLQTLQMPVATYQGSI